MTIITIKWPWKGQGANLELNFQVIEASDTDLRSDYYLPSEVNKVCK